jgi:acyl-CoA thioester hydrolase
VQVKDVEIRWRDMDAFGHVNNAVFLTYLEAGRDQWLESVAHGQVMDFVVRRVEIDFTSQLYQADGSVRVTVDLAGVGTSSVTTRERITALSDGRVVAEASCVLVHLDATRTRSAPMDAPLRALFGA